MSWGERSCKNVPCPRMRGYEGNCPKFSKCNVNCPDYIWDGHTPPDSSNKKIKMTKNQLKRARKKK